MLKISTLSIIAIAFMSMYFTSCEKSDNSIYFYSAERDTIAPKIVTIAPLNSDIFYYGDDIHIVGSITDLETIKTNGKLKSVSLIVNRMNATYDTILSTTPLLSKSPDVDGKEWYKFTEKVLVNTGSTTTYYQLNIKSYDYSGRFTEEVRKFTIQ